MNELNIPVYRAKKIDSDEYVVGYYSKRVFWCYGVKTEWHEISDGEKIGAEDGERDEIDISTLAIHFPDWTDSEDNPIFASLQSDGKGGDYEVFGRTFIFENKLKLVGKDRIKWDYELEKKQIKIKAIGIQK